MSAERPDRALVFVGSSRDDLSSFPAEVKLVTGYALRQIQFGREHRDAKLMRGDLREVLEVAVHDNSGERTFRTACMRKSEIVYVLHAFQKKSTSGISTPTRDLKLIKRRLRTARNHWEDRYAKRHP